MKKNESYQLCYLCRTKKLAFLLHPCLVGRFNNYFLFTSFRNLVCKSDLWALISRYFQKCRNICKINQMSFWIRQKSAPFQRKSVLIRDFQVKNSAESELKHLWIRADHQRWKSLRRQPRKFSLQDKPVNDNPIENLVKLYWSTSNDYKLSVKPKKSTKVRKLKFYSLNNLFFVCIQEMLLFQSHFTANLL